MRLSGGLGECEVDTVPHPEGEGEVDWDTDCRALRDASGEPLLLALPVAEALSSWDREGPTVAEFEGVLEAVAAPVPLAPPKGLRLAAADALSPSDALAVRLLTREGEACTDPDAAASGLGVGATLALRVVRRLAVVCSEGEEVMVALDVRLPTPGVAVGAPLSEG